MKKINLNDYVYVKLNPKGVDIYYHRNDDLNKFEREMPKIDENGFTRFQLHEFMALYGSYMELHEENVLTELNFYFDDKDVNDYEENT